MKHTIYPILFLFILFNIPVNAGEVNSSKASEVAEHFYFSQFGDHSATRPSDFNAELVQTFSRSELNLYHIFNVNSAGYVIVSAWDGTVPVLAAGNRYAYNREAADLPPAMQEMLELYADQIFRAVKNQIEATDKIAAMWQKYQEQRHSGPVRSVSPLVSTSWNQSCYYNALCPYDAGAPYGYCNHVPVGCVAVSMAQIMKYYDYPETGTGSNSYYIYPYGTQSANFGNTTYDWSSMPDAVYGANDAVATLMYHCGVSVDMQYGPNGSGAYTGDARVALINHFNYSSDASYVFKSYYSNSAWEQMLRTELDEGRPVIYRGQGSGGHAWVCDGYTGSSYFHMNWGWGGYYDGYFYLSDLTPGSSNFTGNQAMIMGIVPAEINFAPPSGLQATVIGGQVELSWSPPSRDLLGYNVYRNGEKINLNLVNTTYYTDENPPAGVLEYSVTAVYPGGESGPAGPVTVNIGLSQQILTLESGWNAVSSNLLPLNADPEAICTPIDDHLIIMQNLTGVFYPAYGVNTLGEWDRNSGYLIKVSENCELTLSGYPDDDRTLVLNNGWNLMPVISECEVNTEELFAPVINYVRIVKDAGGTGIYWPAQNINTLPVLEPGKSYHVKIFTSKSVTFPECESLK